MYVFISVVFSSFSFERKKSLLNELKNVNHTTHL